MKKGNISDAVIRRLPRYYRQLNELCARGIVRTSSHALGQEMGITASQIRQDFSCFGEFGQQGYGYNVEELRSEIGHILGVDNDNHLVIVGVGNLGRAILNNFPFESAGFSVDASFDVAPNVIDTAINGVPVHSTDDLEDYIKTKKQALSDYENRDRWAEKILVNIANAGYFSSDRTIEEYNRDIWHLEQGAKK